MPMRGHIACLLIGAGLVVLSGCSDFFSKQTGTGSGGGSSVSRVYVTNNGDNKISVFRIDDSTGALTVTSSAATGTAGPQGIVVVAGKFLFAGSNGTGVSGYTINSSDGVLTMIGSSPFIVGNQPRAVAVDPAGKFLYVANTADLSIGGFTIDASTGVLTPIAGTPLPAGGTPVDIKVDAADRFVYAALGSAGIIGFAINSSTGALTQIGSGPIAAYAGGKPNSLAVEKTGRYLYATDGVNGVEVFSINATTGALTALTASPIAAQANPSAAATDPSGTFLYVANRDANNVSAYAILGNGLLSEISGSPFPAGTNPQAVGVDPTGKFVFVANNGGGISEYQIENAISGKLISAGTASSGTNPAGIAFK